MSWKGQLAPPGCPLCCPNSGPTPFSSAPDVWWGPGAVPAVSNTRLAWLSFQGADAEAWDFGTCPTSPSRGQVRMSACFPGTYSCIPSDVLDSLCTAGWKEHEKDGEDFPR